MAKHKRNHKIFRHIKPLYVFCDNCHKCIHIKYVISHVSTLWFYVSEDNGYAFERPHKNENVHSDVIFFYFIESAIFLKL